MIAFCYVLSENAPSNIKNCCNNLEPRMQKNHLKWLTMEWAEPKESKRRLNTQILSWFTTKNTTPTSTLRMILFTWSQQQDFQVSHLHTTSLALKESDHMNVTKSASYSTSAMALYLPTLQLYNYKTVTISTNITDFLVTNWYKNRKIT